MYNLMSLLFIVIGLSFSAETIESENSVYYVKKDGVDELDWWQTSVFYQIYPRSFMDSNNDGIGDLQGIIQKLDHLADMGITATWLSPVFVSPQVDQGYDISDYYSIDPIFGTIDDLRELVDKAHELGIKIILDFVPNHTSDEHEWFLKSVSDPDGEYGDFYVWRDCEKDENGTVIPPNNWISVFKDSAWEFNEQRYQCYYHDFAIAQPDLNYNNPKVVESMKDVLRYWLSFGVDGFRCDAVIALFEDPELRDEPLSNKTGVEENDHDYLDHIYTENQPQNYEMVYQWREVLDNFTRVYNTETKVMMTEVYSATDKAVPYYGLPDGSRRGAHFSFNFYFLTLTKGFGVGDLTRLIQAWLVDLPKIYTYNWVIGNHDVPRLATRLGTELVDSFNMLTAFFPGVMITYNGEEIGMENGEVTCEEGYDPQAIKNCSIFDQVSRDFERTPFQWDNSTNAGFNKGAKPWLPVSEKYKEVNLAAQNVDGLSSHYNVYKSLLNMRKIFPKAKDLSIVQLSENVVQFIRKTEYDEFGLVFNVGGGKELVKFLRRTGKYEVVVASVGGSHKTGNILCNDILDLQPYGSVIVHRIGKAKHHSCHF